MSAREALLKLRDLCDRGEYCTGELHEKMRKWGLAGTDRDKIIGTLENDGLVDDARFARAFAHTKAVNSHWGRLKIKVWLKKKRVESSVIAEALDSIDDEEYMECLRQVLRSKHRQLGEEADSYEGRTKIFRNAVGKGYEPSVVSALIKARDY